MNNPNIKVLITGFPRSGTKWTSKAFEAVGLDVGHERWNDNGGVGYMFSYLKNRKHFLDADIVAHQIRDPRYAIGSARKNLEDTTHLVKGFDGNWFDSWIHWNLLAESLCLQAKNHGIPTFRYSVCNAKTFVGIIAKLAFGEVPKDITWPSNNTNHRQDYTALGWKSLPAGVAQLAKRYGFSMERGQPETVKL